MKLDRPALPRVTPPPSVVDGGLAARRGVERVHRAMALPLVRVLEQTVSMVEVQATAAFTELGIADELRADPRTTTDLAVAVGATTDGVDRLLRFLVTRGIVGRSGDGWTLTASSDLLRRDHPDSIRDWVLFQASPWQWGAWTHLAAGIVDGRTPFEHAHDAAYFDFVTDNVEAGRRFDAAMRATSRLQGDLVARVVDLAGVSSICDVGGGTGSLLARLLAAAPGCRGVLFELPSTVARATDVLAAEGVADRVELVPGDMFEALPRGADRYVLSAVIHDWDDDDAVAILRNLRDVLGPTSRGWVVELELPSHDGASLERAYDLLMLTLGGGRERTHEQFLSLYRDAGLDLVDNHRLANGWRVHEVAAV